MSRRPPGTDGSDHEFREKVESHYKGMPLWRAAGWLLLHFSAVPTVLKVAWAVVPYYTIDFYPELTPFALLAMWLLAMLFWSLALPATYKEKLPFVKVTNTFMVLGTALHVVTFYKYYLMTPPQQQYPRRVWKHLQEERGWQGDHWLSLMTFAEAAIDVLLLVGWGGTAACLHSYIIRKMQVEKRLAQGRSTGAGNSSPAAAAAPRAIKAAPGPRMRRPGRA